MQERPDRCLTAGCCASQDNFYLGNAAQMMGGYTAAFLCISALEAAAAFAATAWLVGGSLRCLGGGGGPPGTPLASALVARPGLGQVEAGLGGGQAGQPARAPLDCPPLMCLIWPFAALNA
jgi:hypothetical protein